MSISFLVLERFVSRLTRTRRICSAISVSNVAGSGWQLLVGRAADGEAGFIQDVGVRHGGGKVFKVGYGLLGKSFGENPVELKKMAMSGAFRCECSRSLQWVRG
jgi:hypothetical protein